LCIHVAGKEQKSQDKGKFLEAKWGEMTALRQGAGFLEAIKASEQWDSNKVLKKNSFQSRHS
jgi:hypothetical protein